VANQAAMVALGRPGVGEELFARVGFAEIERVDIPFAWEFADPDAYARALLSTGPAHEAVEAVGEEAFIQSAVELAQARVRHGLPLRAVIAVVGYVARKPEPATWADTGFVRSAPTSPDVRRMYDDDVDELGYVMNVSRLWSHQVETHDVLFELMGKAARAGSLTFRQRGILVAACASTLGDSYCSLAWGTKLAGEAGDDVAAGVLRGDDALLDVPERALARWARQITRDPNSTRSNDVEALRTAGFDEGQIFAITTFVALRIAFSTVNDALGARPDHQLGQAVPPPVRAAVTFGRPMSAGGSSS
jgi:alkylhydroperoxidase family enzyme